MGGTLKDVSTQNKLLHFGGLKRPAKLVQAMIFLARTNMQTNNREQMYSDGIFWVFFLYLRGFVAELHLQMHKYK